MPHQDILVASIYGMPHSSERASLGPGLQAPPAVCIKRVIDGPPHHTGRKSHVSESITYRTRGVPE